MNRTEDSQARFFSAGCTLGEARLTAATIARLLRAPDDERRERAVRNLLGRLQQVLSLLVVKLAAEDVRLEQPAPSPGLNRILEWMAAEEENWQRLIGVRSGTGAVRAFRLGITAQNASLLHTLALESPAAGHGTALAVLLQESDLPPDLFPPHPVSTVAELYALFRPHFSGSDPTP